jgi:hypothetical protein
MHFISQTACNALCKQLTFVAVKHWVYLLLSICLHIPFARSLADPGKKVREGVQTTTAGHAHTSKYTQEKQDIPGTATTRPERVIPNDVDLFTPFLHAATCF